MSLWTSIRDAVDAPINAIGGFFNDLFAGKNVFSSTGQFATREFLGADVALPVVQENTNVLQWMGQNRATNALLIGIPKDLEMQAQTTVKVDQGQDLTWTEARDNYAGMARTGAKVAAVVLTAGAAAPGLSAGAVATSAYSAGQGINALSGAIETGNLAGIYNSLSGYSGNLGDMVPSLPDLSGVQDAVDTAKDLVNKAKDAAAAAGFSSHQAQSLVDTAKANTPLTQKGYTSNIPGVATVAGSVTPSMMVAVAGLGCLFLLGGKK